MVGFQNDIVLTLFRLSFFGVPMTWNHCKAYNFNQFSKWPLYKLNFSNIQFCVYAYFVNLTANSVANLEVEHQNTPNSAPSKLIFV